MKVRFAPSPTGNVHIGNMRVAIFNWLFARHHGGEFILRVEDTDLERSTAEAIDKMKSAMNWLGLNYDGEPLYQTARRPAHAAAAQKMLAAGVAYQRDAQSPVVLRIGKELFAPNFVSEPRDAATIDYQTGVLAANRATIFHTVVSPKSGEEFITPVNWDTLAAPRFLLANGEEIDALPTREKCGDATVALAEMVAGKIVALKFRRRYVFFDDLVLGRCEKPLDSIRDFAIARSDGSPIFHLANVADDIFQGVTHVLRGNDHVENTFRHLFLFQALGAPPPVYGHFPMIVNQSGKPYSKRDGDAYVGDFQTQGFLPDALFNFLALCGWAPGDDREIMSRDEMVKAFSLDRVSKSAAQFDRAKLNWLNRQYLLKLSDDDFIAALKAEAAGFAPELHDDNWWQVLAATQRERLDKIGDFMPRCRYFFAGDFAFDQKAVKKNLQNNDGAGRRVLADLAEIFRDLPEWEIAPLAAAAHRYAEEHPVNDAPLPLNAVAQPLRVACTGAAVSPGIGETLFLLGRAETLKRIERALKEQS
ncbi:MAG: glutamate--tRNA ligase [Planctomycetota bacterium]|jgi:glutamyl-tRNA synthetase|nr:glutamate--tRNA ligase [Planctomycetota bacterium]